VNLTYKWCNVGMLDYDKETELFLVQKIDDEGRILDTRGHPVVNGGVTPGGQYNAQIFKSIERKVE